MRVCNIWSCDGVRVCSLWSCDGVRLCGFLSCENVRGDDSWWSRGWKEGGGWRLQSLLTLSVPSTSILKPHLKKKEEEV